AEGVNVWDPEGKKYIDCLSCYSAVNQGHRHPKIIGALIEQAQRCTLSSRAFYNDRLGEAGKKICETFGYESCLLMNSGAEGVESALKIARNWGYVVKGIPKNEALIISAK
ncbi:ornithine aminotransferase, partial [Kipferlia bialata]